MSPAKQKFNLKFDEHGGYDCMTAAFTISRDGKDLIDIDLFNFGQDQVGEISVEVKAEAERVALICMRALEIDPMRGIEQTLAYERATDILTSECVPVEIAEEFQDGWYDLDSADALVFDLKEMVAYLDSRRLLQHHPEHPQWVILLDEGEPLEDGK